MVVVAIAERFSAPRRTMQVAPKGRKGYLLVVRSGLGASEEAFGGVRGADGVRDKTHGHGDGLFELEIVLQWQVIG